MEPMDAVPNNILPSGTALPVQFVHLQCFYTFWIVMGIHQKFQEAAEQKKYNIQALKLQNHGVTATVFAFLRPKCVF